MIRNNLNGSLVFENWQFVLKANSQNLIALFNFKSWKRSDRQSDETLILPDHRSFLVVLASFKFEIDELKNCFDKTIDISLSTASLRVLIIFAMLTLTKV
ncbi:MAG: hypothetical protein ACTS43_02395 [Candidatus Hodgkinia cicadicola]